jgi:WD40 repeat protein
LACGSFDATCSIYINNGNKFALESSLEGHENEIKGVNWGILNENYIATCSRDKSIWIWEKY